MQIDGSRQARGQGTEARQAAEIEPAGAALEKAQRVCRSIVEPFTTSYSVLEVQPLRSRSSRLFHQFTRIFLYTRVLEKFTAKYKNNLLDLLKNFYL